MNKGISGCLKIVLIGFGIIFILGVLFMVFGGDYQENGIQNKRKYVDKEWRDFRNDEYIDFVKAIKENKIQGCGEFKIKQYDEGEYYMACTSDGINWEYYVVFRFSHDIFRPSEKDLNSLQPPE